MQAALPVITIARASGARTALTLAWFADEFCPVMALRALFRPERP